MKKSAVVMAGMFLLSMFSVLGVSADVDGIFDIYEKDGQFEQVWWYNHDNTVLKGSAYKAQVAQLLADGYKYRGYAVTESLGGGGPQFGSYDEDYFVKTTLQVVMEGGIGIIYRTTPEGLEYFDEETQSYIPVPETMEVPVEVEELLMKGVFDHDQYQQIGQHWVRIWGSWGIWVPDFGWVDTGDDKNEPFLTVINEDGTEAVWHIVDVYGTSVAMMVVTGEEEWDTRTIIFELPPTPAGAPQLQPKNYGNVLNKPYNKYGLEQGQAVPDIFQQYAKYDNGKVMTYDNSPLDMWFDQYVYKPNHDAHVAELNGEFN